MGNDSESRVMDIDYSAIEGYWFCEKTNDIDCDHGECVGYKIPELGITIFVYECDDTRISIHRD